MSVEPGSRLHEALGADEIDVDSFHHQAIDRLGDGLRATGVAPDGVIEVIERDADGYVLGAQFELQEEWRVDPRFLDIFRQFVQAASDSRSRRAALGLIAWGLAAALLWARRLAAPRRGARMIVRRRTRVPRARQGQCAWSSPRRDRAGATKPHSTRRCPNHITSALVQPFVTAVAIGGFAFGNVYYAAGR